MNSLIQKEIKELIENIEDVKDGAELEHYIKKPHFNGVMDTIIDRLKAILELREGDPNE